MRQRLALPPVVLLMMMLMDRHEDLLLHYLMMHYRVGHMLVDWHLLDNLNLLYHWNVDGHMNLFDVVVVDSVHFVGHVDFDVLAGIMEKIV